ncbi:MAG: 1-acyl-sn-glycerol-3-phosphate acyltransferase [Lachnospiraceae bacterium]|nr:1-acyl-sn-glycerol-3-phosphate acyltransferase [Lachnospiraceae bacterium]
MIRSILVLGSIILFLILTIPVLIVFHFLYRKYPEKIDLISLHMIQCILRITLFLSGTKLTVLGEENVPKDRPVVYIGNHTSYFDVVIGYTRVPGPTGFVAKDSMGKIPLLNLWMLRGKCVFLNRDNVKEGLKSILEAIKEVKEGVSIYIFPEGTRNKTPDTFMEFKEGSFKIPEKSGAPIIPVTFVNSHAIYEDHKPFIRRAHVVVEYGKPIDVSSLDKETKKHMGAYVSSILHETYEKNKAAYFS